MGDYDTILFPTDGTETSERARTEALDVAEAFDADLQVLSVVDISAFPGAPPEDAVDRIESAAGATVDAAAEEARERGLDVETLVEHGGAVKVILDHAGADEVDLVVMGTHGRTGVEHFLAGSVTERVLRESPVPVFVVPSSDEE